MVCLWQVLTRSVSGWWYVACDMMEERNEGLGRESIGQCVGLGCSQRERVAGRT